MLNLLRETYSGKRVFLTGHTGFKGSWLAFILNHLGAEVKGYSLEPENEKCLYNLIKVDTFTNSVFGNILDTPTLEKEILDFNPDFIFHLAAQSLVIRSYSEPVLTYATNVMGSVNVLEALRKYDRACVGVMITTDKVYENLEIEYPYKESDKLGGFDPYSSSKAASEIACSSYRQSFFNPNKYELHQKSIATARSGNVIGGGDWSENRIIPDLIRAIDENQSLEIRNPNSIRPWQHLLDPLSGYLLLGAKMFNDPIKYAQAYNFGPSEDIYLTVKELVEKVHSIMGKGSYIISDLLKNNHEAKLLQLDIQKAQKELLWSPKLSADQTIELTADWYKEYAIDPYTVTFKQVVDYFNL